MKKTATIALVSICVVAVGSGVYWWMGERQTSDVGAQSQTTQQVEKDADSLHVKKSTQPSYAISEQVRIVTVKSPVDIKTRRQAVAELSRNLTADDLTVLMDFICGEKPESFRDTQWRPLVGSIITKMRRQNKAPQGMSQTLVTLYRNSADPVIKDYAIQHMRSWYVDRGSFDKHEANVQDQNLLLDNLIHAAGQNKETYSGTALMALHAIQSSPDLAQDKTVQQQIGARLGNLDALFLNAASDLNTNKHCRISALQVCAIRGLQEVLPVARKLAEDRTEDTNIRISAIAVIGQLGEAEQDSELLMELQGQGRRLAWAAKPAHQKLTVLQKN